MRYLVTIIFFVLCGVSYGQTITGTKTRTPGVWLSSKDTATNRTSADSIQLIANRADSSLRFYWSVGAPSRKFAFGNDLALKLNISDTAAMLTNYVQKFGSLTNRRVPFVNNLGQLKDTAGLTFEGGALNVTGGVINTGALNSGNINASGDVAFQNALFVKYYNNIGGQYFHKFGGTDASSDYRWRFDTYGTESGSNSGSDLIMYKYTDGGAYNGYNITMERATGNTRFYNALQVDGGITGTLSTAAQPNITSLGTLTSLTVTGGISTSNSFTSSIGSSVAGNPVLIAKVGNDPRWTIGMVDADGTNTGSNFFLYTYLDNGTPSTILKSNRANGKISSIAEITSSITNSANNSIFGTNGSTGTGLKVQSASGGGTLELYGRDNAGTDDGFVSFYKFDRSTLIARIYARGSTLSIRDNTNTDIISINPGAFTVNYLGTGTVYSNAGVLTNTNPSDSALKDSIKTIPYGLAEILKLKPKTFYYKSDSAKSFLKYGFIAQDVKSIMPSIVRKLNPKDSNSKLGLETDGIYVTMVKAIQELKVENDSKQLQIDNLRYQLEEIKAILLKNNIK